MKIDKILKINSVMVPIVSESLTLERGAVGRGIFVVQSEVNLSGIAELSIGMDQKYELFASCYIESCRQIDKKQQRLVIREFSGVLGKRLPLSMRNTNARDILKTISEITGLVFKLEDADWNKQAIPYFINIGNGFEALDLFPSELGIEDFVWQCQPDGSIYIGSLQSCQVNKTILGIPAEYFKELSASGASCPLVPGFRPGKRIRIGNGDIITIDKISISEETMRINF
ncbi:MAG: hypothetical protein KAS17_07720 [Victivallaceae bacterium]|nr:hypothetical protein [Victivallaceae bacterium]